ncbi:bifunctional Zinc finger [Babesia duncani]|uniref:Bifunctional Zinc finger n=1 Tax=Babesia duncani TaxID=323732 RepID=A0AAD9UQK5_9APIC|nr:bifunctional Zinc finger [Babesia duncani]
MFESADFGFGFQNEYFCHVCNQHRSTSQVILSPSGDIECQVCRNQGFVEKVAPRPEETSYVSYGTAAQNTFPPDPFIAAFGMPIEHMFNVVRGNMLRYGGMAGFNPLDMQVNTMFPFTARAMYRNRPDSQRFPFNVYQMATSLFQNPNDNLAMNQIIQFLMENDPNRYGSPPVAKGILDTLEKETLTEEMAKELGSCAICTDDYNKDEQILWLNKDKTMCGHAFHVDCIIPWLKQHNSCPVCRFELPTDDPNYNAQREDLRRRIREQVHRNQEQNPTDASATDNPNAPDNDENTCRVQ